MSSKSDPNIGLTVGQAATLVGRSERWVQKLRKDGFISDDGRGTYTVVGLVRGIIAYFEDALDKSTRKNASNAVAEARAAEIQQRMAMKQRELLEFDEVKVFMAQLLTWMRAELVGLPAQLTRDRTDLARYREVVDAVLTRMAERCEETARALEKGDLD